MFKDPTDPTNEELSAYLLKAIPKDLLRKVFNGWEELCPDFVGFVKCYYHLSKVIPKEYEVYDFGAAHNLQSWFFREHKAYYAIEPECINGRVVMLQPNNCITYASDAKHFLDTCGAIPENSFAIVNYVPNWYNRDVYALVKERFQNVYTFYPCNIENL